jgi:fucose permease
LFSLLSTLFIKQRRWLMLALFASHALCNNLVCYTFAPVADLAIEYYSHATAFPLDLLITIFFITYVLLAFPASRFVEQHGLRSGVLLGACAMRV